LSDPGAVVVVEVPVALVEHPPSNATTTSTPNAIRRRIENPIRRRIDKKYPCSKFVPYTRALKSPESRISDLAREAKACSGEWDRFGR
jgi:hypothetical protein